MSGAHPSAAYLRLVGTPVRDLRPMMLRGEQPDPDALVGWEYRGTNLPATSTLLGLRRFRKGFTTDDGARVLGYNVSVDGADLSAPWTPRPQRDGRRAFAWFAVRAVDPESVDNRHLQALLLDYGAVPEPEPGIAGRLRDYLVRVDPGSDEILLGRADLACGRRRVSVGWFVLERLGPSPPAR